MAKRSSPRKNGFPPDNQKEEKSPPKRTAWSQQRTKMEAIEDYADSISYDLDRLGQFCDFVAELAGSSSAVVKPANMARVFRLLRDELEIILDGAQTISSYARPPQKPAAVAASEPTG